MNYGQFLQMIPEATLVAILIIVFFADFALHRSESKGKTLYGITAVLLLLQLVPCALADSTEAFAPMAQFGIVEILSNTLFDKKTTTQVTFFQETGGTKDIME